jgi:hypothetical protein
MTGIANFGLGGAKAVHLPRSWGLGPVPLAKAQRDYIRSVRNLAMFLGRSPDTATAEDLRLFQLHLTETHNRPPTIDGTVSALRFVFAVTLGRADVAKSLTFVAEPAEDSRHSQPRGGGAPKPESPAGFPRAASPAVTSGSLLRRRGALFHV